MGNGNYAVGELAVKMKGTLFYAIYNHTLEMNPSVASGEIEGKIIAAVTDFHNVMEDSGFFIFRTLSSPVPLVGLSMLLVYRMGWYSLIGIGFCLLFETIHFFIANHNSTYL